MLASRVIPTLLIKGDEGLYKGQQFSNYRYIGDPINTVRIFNIKEVDEIAILDINATKSGEGPNFEVIEEIASECFIPMAYGGGISTLSHAAQLFRLGVEKVVLNTSARNNPQLITEISNKYGSQAVVVAIDVIQSKEEYFVYQHESGKTSAVTPLNAMREAVNSGAGEILLTSVNQEGSFSGYDLKLLSSLAKNCSVPIIASGGAGYIEHFSQAVHTAGASAVSAGSMFVFQSKGKGVLISYPSQVELAKANLIPEAFIEG